MGHTYARVVLRNPREPGRALEVELLVDTGSTYTWLRRERLERLGIEPMSVRRFRTVEGRTLERAVGEAVVECLGERATTIVVFGEPGDAEVLGVHALEGLGLEVDPTTGELRRSEAILAI